LIIGGIKISKPGTDHSHWRYTWQGKVYQISGIERITGMSRGSIYRCIRQDVVCFVGYLSCGTVLPMLTKHFARKYAPEALPKNLLTERLKKEKYLDLPITELEQEQMDFRTAIDFVSGEPIYATRKRLESMRLHRLFATMPRPNGMIDEEREWVKPDW